MTKFKLANAQDWLRYFEGKLKEGPPWFHDGEVGEWNKTAQDGIRNWTKCIKELEAELAGLTH